MTRPGVLWKHWRIDAIGAAVCAAATLLVYFAGIHPLSTRQEASELQQRDLETVEQRAARQKLELTALRRRLADTQRSLTDKPIRLEPVRDINRRLAQISRLAGETGLRAADLQTGEMSEGTYYDATRVSVKGSGSYQAFTQFLQRLDSTFPDMGASAFDLKASGRNGSGNADFQFDACWFHAKARGKGND